MAPATGEPSPPPEAALLRLAREAAGMSPETAAAAASIKLSGSRWRQIEAGYRKDTKREVTARPDTLAHMAHAVSLTPERLAEAGREDASEILREILRSEAPAVAEPAAQGRDEKVWAIFSRLMDAATVGMTPRQRLLYTQRHGEQVLRQAEELARHHGDGRRDTG